MRKIALLLMIALVQCGCAGSAPEPTGDTESAFMQSEPITEEASVSVEIFADDETPFSVLGENALLPDESGTEETILSDEPDSSEDINRAIVPEIWGEFIVPENWREILTTEKAFERFDEITAPLPEGASPEDEIVLLMNRNVLCFDTAYVNSFEFIDSAQGLDYRSDDILHVRVRSEYFSTIQDIKNLYAQTYTEECANRLFYGTEDRPLQTFIKDENGIIWVDMRCVLVWSTSPFYNPSYIEIVSQSESDCEFLWHYVSYDYGDYFTDYLPHEFFPFHNQIQCYAVKENDEWKLTFLIYDNPTYSEPITEEASVSVETFADDEKPFSASGENTLLPDESGTEETILSDEPDSSKDINGAIVPEIWGEFIVPKNWREILTTEEAFERFDEITAPLLEGASPEDEIVLLMNRNVLCFDTAYVIPFEFIDPEQEFNYSSDDILHARVRSEYFNTIQDIKNLYEQTYTEECANRLFYGTEDRPRQTFIKDEDGIIWVDMRTPVWSTNPFYHPSYIEIVSQSESDCEFMWHFGGVVDCSGPLIHKQIRCNAIKENSEWKLTFLIYDNPTYME